MVQIAENPKSLAQQGETFRLMGKYDLAIDYFQRALELKPNYAWVHAHLGASYRDSKRANNFNNASAALGKAIKLDPNYAWAHANLGLVNIKQHDYPEAEKCFQQAISIDNNYAWAYAHLGQACYLQDTDPKLEEAQNHLSTAIRCNSEYAYAYALRSAVFSRMKKYENAVFDILTAIQIDNTIYSQDTAKRVLNELLATRNAQAQD
ncbi:tetratricopeptide repeat protein [Oscillatoria sp. HE19RPO]|uniref:tetratricopeptide repeat protein n=1 Tax=Oscillatoria sp. HE19RPO TaxID=2954806 RepID=UPI0020C480E1|nr:tetratricopeptide repeat protein [Oscillatoria sp. HE19RPO]